MDVFLRKQWHSDRYFLSDLHLLLKIFDPSKLFSIHRPFVYILAELAVIKNDIDIIINFILFTVDHLIDFVCHSFGREVQGVFEDEFHDICEDFVVAIL